MTSTTTPSAAPDGMPNSKKEGFRLPTSERIRENITGWLYISPAMLLISIFGLFPIGYAFYMSLYRWRLSQGRFLCMEDDNLSFMGCLSNYTEIVGDWWGAAVFLLGLGILVGAYWLWAGEKQYFLKPLFGLNLREMVVRAILPAMLIFGSIIFINDSTATFQQIGVPLTEVELPRRLSDNGRLAWEQSAQSQLDFAALRGCDTDDASVEMILACLNATEGQARTEGFLQITSAVFAFGLGIWLLLFAHRSGLAKLPRFQETPDILMRGITAFLIVGIGVYFVSSGFSLMLAKGDPSYLNGLTITLYYAFGSVPLQLGLGMVLAYVLYQNIRGKQIFRMIFFLPYVTPAVAAAVVFRVVFNPREGLANKILEAVGLQPQGWINEARPFLNAFFGLDLEGFWAGPSMALVSIIVLGIWTYTGYNAVIFLAGLGQIPEDLYEAAKVDGANSWHLFRFITFPLLSPITFYLSVLAFIGTFKAFNHIFVMRTPFAQGTVDAASLIIFDTFKSDFQYGLATAQAILLFLIILGLTQVQRTFFEKKVFYG